MRNETMSHSTAHEKIIFLTSLKKHVNAYVHYVLKKYYDRRATSSRHEFHGATYVYLHIV